MTDTVRVDRPNIELVCPDGAKKLYAGETFPDLRYQRPGDRTADPHQFGHTELWLYFKKPR